MEQNLSQLRQSVNKRLAQLTLARAQYKAENAALEQLEAEQGQLKEALAIAQNVAQDIQRQAHAKIADVVSRSLETVFGEDAYQFKINFEQKRGRTEASLVFEREGMELDPMSSAGGGVIDCASFALRLSCLLLNRPPLRRTIIADEPFKHLSTEYRGRMRELLITLAKELRVQFILVSHIEELKCGKIIEI